MKNIVLLGATGSIGTQTLDVVRMHADELKVVAMAVNSSAETVSKLARKFNVRHIALADERCRGASCLASLAADGVQVSFGAKAVACLVEDDDVDVVVNALCGAAGLRASYETLACGHTLALANKESLVVGGQLIMKLAAHERLLPIDSEHSAIFQCYLGEDAHEARRILLTCSGGPFRGYSRTELTQVTPQQALAHPTWAMGPKITIDSATLMNKGLEVIEAHHLFGVAFDNIDVVVHPQSCIHSMVEYVDGSVKAHLGVADMRIPIQYALSWPHRWESPADEIDFTKLHPLEFFDPDVETFRCLTLACAAGRAGGTLPCVMNAANEVAVGRFLAGGCTITDIDACVEAVMEAHDNTSVESLEQLEEIDIASRRVAADWLDTHIC